MQYTMLFICGAEFEDGLPVFIDFKKMSCQKKENKLIISMQSVALILRIIAQPLRLA